MSEHRRTLSKRLSRSIMLLAIPIFAVALTVFYQHSRDLLYKEANERSITTLNTTVQLVSNYVSSIETAARSNLWLLEENFNPDSLQSVSQRIVQFNKSVLSCSVCAEPDAFPQYGRYFSVYSFNDGDSVISMFEPEYEYFEKNWYKIPMQKGHACWINPFSDFSEGTINHHDAVGSFCIPIRPNGGRIAGVVSVDFSFRKLREIVFATHHPYPSSYYMLLGPSGGYLIHPETRLLYKKSIFSATDSVSHPDIIALGRAMTSGQHGTMHVMLDDAECHVCYAPVPNTDWSVALVCHEDDVLADYNQLVIALVVIVVIGIVLIWWLTRKVVQRNIGPLNELMEATKKIADGNYDSVIPASTHKDAVGNLQNAFRKMQLAIMSHSQEIIQTAKAVKKEAAELEKTLPQVQEKQKRKKLFIQNVSRQFIEPLNIINGLSNVLQSLIATRDTNTQQQQSVEMQKITATMKHYALHLHRTTLMLFDSSDIGHADTERYRRCDRVVCNELGQECVRRTQEYYPVDNVRLESHVSDSLIIQTNRRYMTLTLLELLHNSAKYSDGQHIVLRITQTEKTVRFIVEDVGPGLPKGFEEVVFVPFSKVDDLSEGLGLGLPLCKGHLAHLGGNVSHDASYEQGCRIIVEVPKTE